MRRGHFIAAAITAALALTGCSGKEDLTYEKKRDYLRKVAVRGAETHALIAASEGNPDKGRCEKAEDALNDDAPWDGTNTANAEWQVQVRAFFVDSCVSGKPKELPPLGAPVSTPTPSPPLGSPSLVSPSAVPSATP